MIFVTLSRLRGKATKEDIERTSKIIASEPKVKVLGFKAFFPDSIKVRTQI